MGKASLTAADKIKQIKSSWIIINFAAYGRFGECLFNNCSSRFPRWQRREIAKSKADRRKWGKKSEWKINNRLDTAQKRKKRQYRQTLEKAKNRYQLPSDPNQIEMLFNIWNLSSNSSTSDEVNCIEAPSTFTDDYFKPFVTTKFVGDKLHEFFKSSEGTRQTLKRQKPRGFNSKKTCFA